MLEKLITPEVKAALQLIVQIFPFTLLSRLLWHRHKVREGERLFWSMDLFWECLTAIACTVVAAAIAKHFDLGILGASGLGVVLGHLGLRGLESYFVSWIANRKGSK